MKPAPYPDFDGTQVCAQVDPEAYFPPQGGFGVDNRYARELCRDCPFQQPCLDFALTHVVVGVWGGTTVRERKAIQNTRGIVPVLLDAADHGRPVERVRKLAADGMSNTEIGRIVGRHADTISRILRDGAA